MNRFRITHFAKLILGYTPNTLKVWNTTKSYFRKEIPMAKTSEICDLIYTVCVPLPRFIIGTFGFAHLRHFHKSQKRFYMQLNWPHSKWSVSFASESSAKQAVIKSRLSLLVLNICYQRIAQLKFSFSFNLIPHFWLPSACLLFSDAYQQTVGRWSKVAILS